MNEAFKRKKRRFRKFKMQNVKTFKRKFRRFVNDLICHFERSEKWAEGETFKRKMRRFM